MGESKWSQDDLEHALMPFRQRASEAEDRLSRLEAAFAKEKDAGNEELLKKISQLELAIERAKSEAESEREKARKLEAENAKNHYRILHLVRALNGVEIDVESKSS